MNVGCPIKILSRSIHFLAPQYNNADLAENRKESPTENFLVFDGFKNECGVNKLHVSRNNDCYFQTAALGPQSMKLFQVYILVFGLQDNTLFIV